MKVLNPHNKIIEAADLVRTCNKLVFTNGCFDILHAGHVEYLYEASTLGDVLIVGLNTDASVRRIKGNGRPVNSQTDRAVVLASLSFIDNIIFFDEDTPLNLIKLIRPDVIVKGGDYLKEDVVGGEFISGYGGEVVVVKYKEGFSSSSIISKM